MKSSFRPFLCEMALGFRSRGGGGKGMDFKQQQGHMMISDFELT